MHRSLAVCLICMYVQHVSLLGLSTRSTHSPSLYPVGGPCIIESILVSYRWSFYSRAPFLNPKDGRFIMQSLPTSYRESYSRVPSNILQTDLLQSNPLHMSYAQSFYRTSTRETQRNDKCEKSNSSNQNKYYTPHLLRTWRCFPCDVWPIKNLMFCKRSSAFHTARGVHRSPSDTRELDPLYCCTHRLIPPPFLHYLRPSKTPLVTI